MQLDLATLRSYQASRPDLAMQAAVGFGPAVLESGGILERDILWEHCRNSLGIARLLVQEGRPEALVATACHMAVEMGCRAAMEHAGWRFDGDIDRALLRLAVVGDAFDAVDHDPGAAGRLARAERTVAGLAAWLRQAVPERTWGF